MKGLERELISVTNYFIINYKQNKKHWLIIYIYAIDGIINSSIQLKTIYPTKKDGIVSNTSASSSGTLIIHGHELYVVTCAHGVYNELIELTTQNIVLTREHCDVPVKWTEVIISTL